MTDFFSGVFAEAGVHFEGDQCTACQRVLSSTNAYRVYTSGTSLSPEALV